MDKVLGVDYGRKRIGFAVSDYSGTLALTLRTVELRSAAEADTAIADVCRESGCGRVVLGHPLNMDGSHGEMAREVEALAERLRAAMPGLPVDLWDERLSTSQVDRMLIEADVSRAKRRLSRDKLAAQAILQGYLDRRSFNA